MASINTYKVHYHFETGGKKISPDYVDYVQAAANDFNSLKTVLVTNNNKTYGAGTLAISSVQNVGAPATGILA